MSVIVDCSLVCLNFKNLSIVSISISFNEFISGVFFLFQRYITSEYEVKGKVGCEINSGDELTLTELMCSGKFELKDAAEDQMVALLSCLPGKESFMILQGQARSLLCSCSSAYA